MTRLGPTKRKDLIRYFKELRFDGPYSGKRHQFMVRDDITVWLPTRMKAISGGISSREFSGKRVLRVTNGKRYERYKKE